MSFRVLLNTSLALTTGNLWVWVFNMTFNQSPRNAAVDKYVLNMNRSFRWRLVWSFDLLLRNWYVSSSSDTLPPNLQGCKGFPSVSSCVSTPEAAPLHTYVARTLTHEPMHTQILESPDVCFHRHQADSCTLNPKNAICWCDSEARGNGVCAHVRGAAPGCSDTAFTSTLLPTDYTNGNSDRLSLCGLGLRSVLAL